MVEQFTKGQVLGLHRVMGEAAMKYAKENPPGISPGVVTSALCNMLHETIVRHCVDVEAVREYLDRFKSGVLDDMVKRQSEFDAIFDKTFQDIINIVGENNGQEDSSN